MLKQCVKVINGLMVEALNQLLLHHIRYEVSHWQIHNQLNLHPKSQHVYLCAELDFLGKNDSQ
ncbi:Uncharacterised protein [Klebsiella pneumoniae]|nr:Uncharacterised protein [Klebsiella pneumoniae]